MRSKFITYNLKLLTTIFIVVSLVIGYELLVAPAGAQMPAQVLLTWQANNFYPADYQGKALATPKTPVSVSAEFLRNGKFLDISKSNFTWLVDEKLLSSGVGLKEVVFNVNKSPGDSHFMRVSINSNGEIFGSSVRVPVSKPILALEAAYPDALVRAGSRATVEAVPYFFNVSSLQNLVFSWQVGDGNQKESGSDNELVLNVGTPTGVEPITIFGSARNVNDLLEFASDRIRLIVY
ncbi:MAG: hypothetical protein UY26_C0001G0047 [Candidatus Jorgensenbacteria bacterium GW2011_GWA1_48_13]|uniref:PKD domain-containing protein n=2 Tax=Candidatus Joergenseniibacteriota TaxID=1752739 RepID=A0A0G1W946_9BACT|nr:MAG: hypothetical protein UY26_C0001G0047 [Candidatus Jorgensenbacteria bacterium GW2011_GWA1_48_13]KKU99067.1 MAG: hypothetical protein UY32_C0007G0011 [Candidatus Jorgensenbacteria bacterium GW2011_GWC1_48_8]KKW15293.1 MAG: hypothetical protein UY55_C0001G0047 [Candidatus Jorgensenbacteria bacterium GW2011_GWB1_50_10]